MFKVGFKSGLVAGISLVAIAAATGSAMAGGFAIREQGALGQGASFAGAGASTALSAMFFNSAAVTVLDGLNTDSSISWIAPEGNLTAQPGSTFYGAPGVAQSTDIARDGYVPASYASYQFKHDPRLYVGIGVNSAFGLKTEPETRWAGSTVGDSTRLFTTNFNPTLGYRLSDQLSVGVGAQFEYAKGVLKFATTTPGSPSTYFEGTDFTAGATAGLMYTPTPSTRIGLGWRSQMTHTLEGNITTPAQAPFGALFATPIHSKVDLRLPDIVNLSVQQAITPNARLLATVEWSGWSRFGGLTLIQDSPGRVVTKGGAVTQPGTVIGKIDGNWDDGWFFSGGLEVDVSKKLTVRAGGAYEISPVTDPTQRIVSIPDNDRIWASLGFTYNWSPSTSIDVGYSHIFVQDAKVDRRNITGTSRIVADLEAQVDIVSVGLRMKLD